MIFNFPIFLQNESDEFQTIKGFDTNNYVQDTGPFKNLSSKDKTILDNWTKFLMKMDVTANSMENFNTTGVCLKERYIKTRGNDQSFVGKGDKRAYNTDFIGLYKNDRTKATLSSSKIRDISGRPTIEEKPKLLCPYVLFKQRQRLHNLKIAFDIDIDDESLERKLYITLGNGYDVFISSIPTETGDQDVMKKKIFDTYAHKKTHKMKKLYEYQLSDLKNELVSTDTTSLTDFKSELNFIDVQKSWLSDHSIVMREISLPSLLISTGTGNSLKGGGLSSNKSISSRKKLSRKKSTRKKTKKKNSSRKKTKRKRSKRKSSKRSKSKKNKKKTTKK